LCLPMWGLVKPLILMLSFNNWAAPVAVSNFLLGFGIRRVS
jgi:hypothetical protein